jgi:hypothetical protein
MKRQTTIETTILEAAGSIPVIVEYQHYNTRPACGNSPREPEHVEITALRLREGLHLMRDISYLLPYINKRDIEEELLSKIQQEREFA